MDFDDFSESAHLDSELPEYVIEKGKIRFKYKGRAYTLFKPRLGSNFYIKIQRQGYRKTTSLHTVDPVRAVTMAVGVIDFMLTGIDPEALKEPSHATGRFGYSFVPGYCIAPRVEGTNRRWKHFRTQENHWPTQIPQEFPHIPAHWKTRPRIY